MCAPSAGIIAAATLVWAAASHAAKTEHGQPVRVSVFILSEGPELTNKQAASLANALRRGLRNNKRLSPKDWNKRLAEFSGEIPADERQHAYDAQMEGLAALRAGNAALAQSKLEQALKGMHALLSFVPKRRLAQTQLALGVALAEQRQLKHARRVFAELLTWRPALRYDTANFRAKFLPTFESVRRRLLKRRRGSIEVSTQPPGARAYVDGRFVGVTPVVAWGLTAGQHIVSFKKSGYLKAAMLAAVDRREQRSYEFPLRANPKFLLVQQALTRARPTLGRPRASAAMQDLRSFLFIDQAVFALARPAGDGNYRLTAYLYDLRSKMRLQRVTLTLKKLSGATRAAKLLYAGVRYDGRLSAPPDKPPPPPKKTPGLLTRWWFWTAIAASAAAVGLAVAFWPRDTSCASEVDGSHRFCVGPIDN